MTHLPDSALRELEGLLGKAQPDLLAGIASRTTLDWQHAAALAAPSLIADLREARERNTTLLASLNAAHEWIEELRPSGDDGLVILSGEKHKTLLARIKELEGKT